LSTWDHIVIGTGTGTAGCLPAIISGNTNAPALTIAERAAQWLRAPAASCL
jgi:choline dehydrogenase-like flavoprotein